METADILRACSDSGRLRILHALKESDLNVQELTEVLKLSQPTVSHHLKVLQREGLVDSKRHGTWAYYKLSESNALIEAILESVQEKDSDTADADKESLRKIEERRRKSTQGFFASVATEWPSVRKDVSGDDPFFPEMMRFFQDGETVLDLGCGGGAFLDHILPRKGRTIGVDYSAEMLKSAQKHLGDKSTGLDLRLGHLEHLPIEDKCVDVAFAYMVLHYVSRPEAAIRDAFRVIRPGGFLVIVDFLKHDREIMRERFAHLWLGFDRDEMSSWLISSGFGSPDFRTLGKKRDVFLMSARRPTN